MPLYMDVHYVGEISVEDTRKAHLADLAVQEKYGVKYHQYWLNEAAGMVFCLMEGPDKASCEATHREANGFTACQIVEVEGGMYNIFMGEDQQLDHGLVLHKDGEIDTGYRFILTLDIVGHARTKSLNEAVAFHELKLPKKPKRLAIDRISSYKGRILKSHGYDCLIAVFGTAEAALECGYEIQKEVASRAMAHDSDGWDSTISMAISVGQPVTENDGFFVRAMQTGRRLCLIGSHNELVISNHFMDICDLNEVVKEHVNIKVINAAELTFIEAVLDMTEANLSEPDFNIEALSRAIGVSRPHLYRKTTAITGRSPINFIRDYRLNKALCLLKENTHNISEVAMEVGFNNPSYFTKCFYEKYGVTPSRVITENR